MLVRILSNQIQQYEDVVNETIDATIPEYQIGTRTDLFKELLFGTAQLWIYMKRDQFEGVVITRISTDISVGGKICTIISIYAPDKTDLKSIHRGLATIVKYAKSKGCDKVDFYTDDMNIINALSDSILWKTNYVQLSIGG